MAKVGLGVGIDFDIGGLRKGVQTATAELERLRKSSNQIGSAISAAMAMPMIGFMSSVVQAAAEARKMRAEMMFPFSHAMHEAQIQADMIKMGVGQRMVEAGLDQPEARKTISDANKQAMQALMANQAGSTLGRSVESALLNPAEYAANLVKAGGGMYEQAAAVGSELLGGNLGPLSQMLVAGNMSPSNFESGSNRERFRMGELQTQASLAMAGGQTEQYESTRMQLERQTYLLAEIARNSGGTR
jgi:hypothetical protein